MARRETNRDKPPSAGDERRSFRQPGLSRRERLHILRCVEGSRDLRIWALAAVLLCLLGSSQAQSGIATKTSANHNSQTYAIPIPGHCSQAHRVDVSVGPPAAKVHENLGWEVSVAINTTECRMYCTYRRKHSPTMPTSLLSQALPPVTTIRFFGTNGPSAMVVVFDPSGLQLPTAGTYVALSPPTECSTSRRSWLASFTPTDDIPNVNCGRLDALPPDFAAPIAAPTPLRI